MKKRTYANMGIKRSVRTSAMQDGENLKLYILDILGHPTNRYSLKTKYQTNSEGEVGADCAELQYNILH